VDTFIALNPISKGSAGSPNNYLNVFSTILEMASAILLKPFFVSDSLSAS
jgi:hypothetical protein